MVKQPSRAQASAEQQAQACWATNTGCPRIGVCLPSFDGLVGESRVRMKSAQRERIVSALYTASGGLCNLLLKPRYFFPQMLMVGLFGSRLLDYADALQNAGDAGRGDVFADGEPPDAAPASAGWPTV